ncbi:hypothetical protein F5Y07DRAFT_312632 [Xylaria sp. FL0933]|nr:hypothetical protein F5Y07DRAFT_312632 [Xylaria sp. FL0933]
MPYMVFAPLDVCSLLGVVSCRCQNSGDSMRCSWYDGMVPCIINLFYISSQLITMCLPISISNKLLGKCDFTDSIHLLFVMRLGKALSLTYGQTLCQFPFFNSQGDMINELNRIPILSTEVFVEKGKTERKTNTTAGGLQVRIRGRWAFLTNQLVATPARP